jgi:pimeloyl-ACP methyl ester carboxylesterase
MGAQRELHVVLVHGTWGRRSDWIAEHSYFRDELNRSFDGRVQFHVFKWSGWNSHLARIRAAIGLNDFLLKRLGKIDGSRVFLVAHSHGGNVVSYAARVSNLANAVAGLVFLGSPFIFFSKNSDATFWQRRMLPLISLVYYCALFVVFSGIMLALLAFNVHDWTVPLIAFSCFLAFDYFFSKGPQVLGGYIKECAQRAGAKAQQGCESE